MGADTGIEREKLTARELQILDHLEQAQNLDAPLTEYAAACNADVKDLYAGKGQLVKKGLLPGRTTTPERADFLPVRVAASCGGDDRLKPVSQPSLRMRSTDG